MLDSVHPIIVVHYRNQNRHHSHQNRYQNRYQNRHHGHQNRYQNRRHRHQYPFKAISEPIRNQL